MTITSRYVELKKRIRELEIKHHRAPGSVELLVVTKTQSVEDILSLHGLGQEAFGENYLQEALPKILHCQNTDIVWHFIGALQRNKTRKVAENFAWLHSLADKHIATRLNAQRPPHLPPLNVCIEVNINADAAKAGITAQTLSDLATHIVALPRLRLRGLMTVPTLQTDYTRQCANFNQLQLLFNALNSAGFNLDTLSMGMSQDLEAAIASGSTIIRVGTAIFGQRK